MTYEQALKYVLENGTFKKDRTGIGTYSVFGINLRFNLANSFPAITSKKLAWKSVVSELLWFLEGSSDERRLCEILHGTRDTEKTTIWSANADANYWKPKAKFEGDLGRVYGVQWRHWNKYKEQLDFGPAHLGGKRIAVDKTEVDQLAVLLEGLKRNPDSRRHILSAWNPAELDDMALPPCHVLCQFYVADNKLSCHLYQRSCDMFLGVPFNIASYSLLTYIIANECNFEVGEFIWTGGDCHIYSNHIDAVKEQLSRIVPAFPTLSFIGKPIQDYVVNDFTLVNYNPLGPIKADMAV